MTTLAAELPSVADGLSPGARAGSLRWRDECVRLLRSHGVHAGRPLSPGTTANAWHDHGEIDLPGSWLLLARRQKSMRIPEALDAAADLAASSSARFHGVVLYRRFHPADAAYVVLPLGGFAELLSALPAEGAQS